MPRKSYNHKILLDENIPPRSRFPRLNRRFNVKHLSGDLHKAGIEDHEVYELAKRMNRIIITFNDKDFKDFANNSKRTGVIGVSTSMSYDHMDKKLTSMLIKEGKDFFYGKLTLLSDDTKIG